MEVCTLGTLGSLSAVTLCVALSQVTPYHCEQGRFTSQVARSLRLSTVFCVLPPLGSRPSCRTAASLGCTAPFTAPVTGEEPLAPPRRAASPLLASPGPVPALSAALRAEARGAQPPTEFSLPCQPLPGSNACPMSPSGQQRASGDEEEGEGRHALLVGRERRPWRLCSGPQGLHASGLRLLPSGSKLCSEALRRSTATLPPSCCPSPGSPPVLQRSLIRYRPLPFPSPSCPSSQASLRGITAWDAFPRLGAGGRPITGANERQR